MNMRKYTFILLLSILLLIVSEYLFITEVYGDRRLSILLPCLLITLAAILGTVRSFKSISGPRSE